ncbi:MAG: response regulator, partial [Deltaproteobacteria bacterium]
RLLEEVFKKDGWQVSTAVDGSEAVSLALQLEPDIILMDMKMPNMNGLEASQKIIEQNPALSIIMMTAYGEMEVVRAALDSGVKKCVTKPFDIIYLRDMVNSLVQEQAS